MELKQFKELFEKRTGIDINNKCMIFNDYELFDYKTKESKHFRTLEEAIQEKVDGKTIEEIIKEKENFDLYDEGGRGASSSNGTGTLFSGAGSKERGGKMTPMPPAYINSLTSPRFKSVEGTAKAFGKSMLDADREFAVLLDKDGFAKAYGKGGRTSVAHLEEKGAWSMHNHPTIGLKKRGITAYNAPSDADLTNWATGEGKGTIVSASGNRTAYVMTKSNNFNSKGFVKAMKSASSTKKGYDADVNDFLRRNQKKYGYKYKTYKF